MAAKLVAATLLMMVSVWLFGCASTSTQRKDSIPQSKVLEEDITEKPTASPGTEGQTSGPAPPVEGFAPPVAPPASRRPARIKFYDKPGSEKGWERVPDRSGDQ